MKSDQIFDLLGALDELSAHIGVLILHLKLNDGLTFVSSEIESSRNLLRNIQQTLLSIGSIVATPNPKVGLHLPEVTSEKVEIIEAEIDRMTENLAPLTVFILQGGITFIESQSHVCRTVARRTERELIKYGNIDENILKYLNRLSDFFFTLARFYSR
jgi:cob(I)alamin adenosyltransferase